jgi:hypothetical protein
MLVQQWTCRIKQGCIRQNGVHRCDDCGRPLANGPTHTVPPDVRIGLSLAAGLAGPLVEKQEEALAVLPALLRDVDRTGPFDASCVCGRRWRGMAPSGWQTSRRF